MPEMVIPNRLRAIIGYSLTEQLTELAQPRKYPHVLRTWLGIPNYVVFQILKALGEIFQSFFAFDAIGTFSLKHR